MRGGSIVLHPIDFEGIELALASVTAIEHLSLPYDAASRRLFGTPIVTTVAATAGVGVVLGADAVVVDVVPSSARHERRPHRAAGSGLARGPGSQREVLSRPADPPKVAIAWRPSRPSR